MSYDAESAIHVLGFIAFLSAVISFINVIVTLNSSVSEVTIDGITNRQFEIMSRIKELFDYHKETDSELKEWCEESLAKFDIFEKEINARVSELADRTQWNPIHSSPSQTQTTQATPSQNGLTVGFIHVVKRRMQEMGNTPMEQKILGDFVGEIVEHYGMIRLRYSADYAEHGGKAYLKSNVDAGTRY